MKMLTGIHWADASDGRTIDIVNPATGEVIDQVPAATAADVQRAVTTAEQAQPDWARTPVRERSALLRRFAELVRQNKERLASVLSRESGKPYAAEALWEFESVAYVFEGMAEIAMHHYGQTMPRGVEAGYDDDIQMTIHEPLGVIACIVPFNFPPAIWSFKAAAALATGNAIVVKAPEQDPLALLLCHELLVEAGIPGRVTQIVTGTGATAGAALVSDPRVAAINFTGSTETGMAIAAAAAPLLTPTHLELGGNDPFVVCGDADLDLAIREAAGKTRNAGQACTAPKRFIVHSSVHDEFVSGLVDALKNVTMGDPADDVTEMGPVVTADAARRIEAQVDDAVTAGAQIALGGRRAGAFYEPTVLTGMTRDMDIMRDTEVFGPVWPVIEFDDLDDAIAISNQSRYGLGGGVFTADMPTAFRLVRDLTTGHVAVNGTGYLRAAELPFGGRTKASGNSRESFAAVLGEVTQSKSIFLRNVLADR